ncbi:MAG: SUMF1/EgtB/PvdO family nonheme iron enzyme [Treponema sp.]|jgi:hypothetical protein|nr:SUMF1/EgtB/PvdO family nonheme iron enzyme [Treponema sp.]
MFKNKPLPEDQVRLKPLLGIRPGVYLAFIYGAVLLLILFFVFLYPGISNPGSILAVKSEPWGAAVLVDGVYREAAPCEVFVSKGSHRIELVMPGFQSKQFGLNIGGRLFGSLMFPAKIAIDEKLEAISPAAAFNDYAGEYAAWSFTGEPSAAYQIPMSLSDGAYRLGPGASDPKARESMQDTVTASARFAVTRAGLRDLVRAKTLLDNQGLSPSPLSLLASARDMIGFLEENPQAALWLGALLTGEAQSAVTSSAWYADAAVPPLSSSLYPEAENLPLVNNGAQINNAPAFQTVQAGGLRFALVIGGLLQGANFPAGTTVDTFYISETVISAAAWEAFLEAAPAWKKENAEALMKGGLVNEDYLETAPGAPFEGVAGISWYAARAFCEWLAPPSVLNSGDARWELRLPTEAEWEYVAMNGVAKNAAPGVLINDAGRFWEWCEDPFAPLGFLAAPAGAVAALGSPERSLRGGSWANSSGSVRTETRASLPPSFCSPFVSFRPVIAVRGNRGDDP